MREWLSGRALPCQGRYRGFESRLPLHQKRLTKVSRFSFVSARDSHPRIFNSAEGVLIPSPAPLKTTYNGKSFFFFLCMGFLSADFQ